MSTPTVAEQNPVAEAHSAIGHSPYVAASRSPAELTVRALVLGSGLGVLFAASSVYLAVKVGMTVSASIPVAVISIAVFRALGKSSILENTITQTAGSAGESLAFGVAAALPALLFLGYEINLFHSLMVAALGGVLGVLMMIPLRHGLIVQEHGKLMYPEGTACADVLIVGEQGGTNARTVIIGFVLGALYKILNAGMKLWKEVVEVALDRVNVDAVTKRITSYKGYLGGSLAAEVSPELLGVGYIIGFRVAGVTFAGGVLSYLVLIPAIKFFGSGLDREALTMIGVAANAPLISEMSASAVRNNFVLYIGAGAVATGGLISLARSFPTIINAFRRGLQTFLASRKGAAGGIAPLRTEQDLPITVVLVGSAALVLLMWLVPALNVNLASAIVIVIFGFFFVTVSSRITGEIGSSSNPISGMVVATLLITCLLFLLLGWTSSEDRFAALTTAAIVGIAASNGGTTAQDLKTAYLVGGTPWRQQIALFVGVLTSAAFIGITLVSLNESGIANIPQVRPDLKISHPSDATETVTEYAYALDPAAVSRLGATQDELARALWAEGFELRTGGDGAASLRAFTSRPQAEVGATRLVLKQGGEAKIADLGTLGAPVGHTLKVGYIRDSDPSNNGKYLTNEAGQIEYLVDPGIGGRVNEYLGKKLERYDAPKARLFSLIIDGILTQKLPWTLVLLGVFIALMLELCGVSSLPFAVGVYLPISTSAPIFCGGLVRYVVDRLRGAKESEAEFSPGMLISSGYIAGGAIAGVVLAVFAIPKWGPGLLRQIDIPHALGHSGLGAFFNMVGESEAADPVASALWGMFFFLCLAAYLLRGGLKGRSGA